jgi:nitroreductase
MKYSNRSIVSKKVMETIEAIMSRRSIRKYRDETIPDDKITLLLRAAMNAPSAGNRQPWHFLVVKNKEKLKKITEIHPYSKMLLDASHAIIVLGDTSVHVGDVKEFWVQDCSAAIENILLAAHAIGLGAVWLGAYPNQSLVKKIGELFGIPKQFSSLAIISLGYPNEEKPTRDNFDPKRIHEDLW